MGIPSKYGSLTWVPGDEMINPPCKRVPTDGRRTIANY